VPVRLIDLNAMAGQWDRSRPIAQGVQHARLARTEEPVTKRARSQRPLGIDVLEEILRVHSAYVVENAHANERSRRNQEIARHQMFLVADMTANT
jgi:hypothetical protein